VDSSRKFHFLLLQRGAGIHPMRFLRRPILADDRELAC
jgi:hypothetical protein